ncbi:MAG: hypothetical protein PVF20_05060 [Desulfobacterales bacterium]|jgi:hypothetical protein
MVIALPQVERRACLESDGQFCVTVITAAAVGQGSLDAFYDRCHRFLDRHFLYRGQFGRVTLTDVMGIRPRPVVIPVGSLLLAFLTGLWFGGH